MATDPTSSTPPAPDASGTVHRSVATHTVDPMARQFCAALIATLLLIFPLRAILGTTTYEAMYGWLFGSVAAVIALSFLLRWVGIPRARSSVVAALGSFAVFVVIGLWAVASMGDPGDDGTLALTVGNPDRKSAVQGVGG